MAVMAASRHFFPGYRMMVASSILAVIFKGNSHLQVVAGSVSEETCLGLET